MLLAGTLFRSLPTVDVRCWIKADEIMNSEVFIDWIKRQGYHVVSTTTSYWYEIMPHTYQAVPYHRLITPSDAEFHQLLHMERAAALRYSTAIEADEGKVSYHVINQDKTYDIAQLSKSTRYDVRKGLRHAGVEPVSLARLVSEGWALRQETCAAGPLRCGNCGMVGAPVQECRRIARL